MESLHLGPKAGNLHGAGIAVKPAGLVAGKIGLWRSAGLQGDRLASGSVPTGKTQRCGEVVILLLRSDMNLATPELWSSGSKRRPAVGHDLRPGDLV